LLRDVRIDVAALVFTVGTTLITGLVFGLAPALQAFGADMTGALKDASRGSTEGRKRALVRNALVVSAIAFACVLVVGAGLLIRSLVTVLEVEMGFDPSRTSTMRVDPDSRVTPAQRLTYMDDVLRRVGQAPGIERAAITDTLPFGRNRTWGAGAKGVTYERGKYPLAFVRLVSEGYPAAMGIPFLAGRDFSASDTAGKEPVMLINKTLAETLWPGEDPIGRYVAGPCAKERRVVGVVSDVRHLSLEQSSGNEMYIPARQCDDLAGSYLVVRSTLPPGQVAATLRSALMPIAPNLASNDFRTLQQIVDRSVSPRRFTVLLLGGFAVFALILASLGIYALISYSVNQRTQEIGIRMALGASARDVQARIIGQTLRLAVIGLVIGASASSLLARSASGLLFGVTAGDPQTFVGMIAVLAIVALVAGYLPARRASRIDPMVALRAE
jgi:predicted permease